MDSKIDLPLTVIPDSAEEMPMRVEMAVIADFALPVYERLQWLSPETHHWASHGRTDEPVKALIHQAYNSSHELEVHFYWMKNSFDLL